MPFYINIDLIINFDNENERTRERLPKKNCTLLNYFTNESKINSIGGQNKKVMEVLLKLCMSKYF